MTPDLKREFLVQVGHSMPSVLVLSANLDAFYKGLGALFIILQIAYLIWKWHKEAKNKNEKD